MARNKFISPGSIPNHTLLENLQLNGKYISNDGGDEGIAVDNDGIVTMSSQLDIGNMSLTTSELDISSGNFTLDSAGEIDLDSHTGLIYFKDGGGSRTIGKIWDNAGIQSVLTLYEPLGTDMFVIATAAHGETFIQTFDDADKNADLTFNIDGFIDMNSAASEDITLDSGGSILLDATDDVLTSSNVGIGNTAPGSTLEVTALAANNEATRPCIEISSFSDANDLYTSAGVLKFHKSANDSVNSYGAGSHTATGEVIGRIEAWGVTNDDDGSSDAAILSSYIEFAGDAVADETDAAGKIIFATAANNDDGDPTPRLTIDDSGVVSLGAGSRTIDGITTLKSNTSLDIDTTSGDLYITKGGISSGFIFQLIDTDNYYHLWNYDNTNYFKLLVAANGATTLSTVDSDGAAGNLTLDPNGDVMIEGSGTKLYFSDFGGEYISSNGSDLSLYAGDDIICNLGSLGSLKVNYANTSTSASTNNAIAIDIDRSGNILSGSDTCNGISMDLDSVDSTGGTIVLTGIDMDLNMDHTTTFTDATCDTNYTYGSGDSGTTFGDNPKIIKMDSTSALVVGHEVSGTGIAANSRVAQIDSETLFRVDRNTTATNNNQTLTFTGGSTAKSYGIRMALGNGGADKKVGIEVSNAGSYEYNDASGGALVIDNNSPIYFGLNTDDWVFDQSFTPRYMGSPRIYGISDVLVLEATDDMKLATQETLILEVGARAPSQTSFIQITTNNTAGNNTGTYYGINMSSAFTGFGNATVTFVGIYCNPSHIGNFHAGTEGSPVTVTMIGISATPTNTGTADEDFTTEITKGAEFIATGNSGSDSEAYGANLIATGAETNIGLQITVPDASVKDAHIKLLAADDTSDYAMLHVVDTGDLTISTIGSGTTDSDIIIDADGEIKLDSATGITKFQLAGDADDLCTLTVAANGVTTIATADSDGTVGHLTLDVDGDINLDADGGNIKLRDNGSVLTTIAMATVSNTVDITSALGNALRLSGTTRLEFNSAAGKFTALNNGTQFSVADSAFAGMILGYTTVGIDAAAAYYTLSATMTCLDDDMKVKFVAPPSGVVEIFASIYFDTARRYPVLGLSDQDTTGYQAISFPNTTDVTNEHLTAAPPSSLGDHLLNKYWVVTGLTPGTAYEWWFAAKTFSSTGGVLRWGGNITNQYPPFIMKATALPTAVADYAVYG